MEKLASDQIPDLGTRSPQPGLGEPPFADAMAAIKADKALPESKRRHWLTSMKRIARGIGRPPESLCPGDPRAFSKILRVIALPPQVKNRVRIQRAKT